MQEESKVQKLCFKVKALKHNTACIKDSKKKSQDSKVAMQRGIPRQLTSVDHNSTL